MMVCEVSDDVLHAAAHRLTFETLSAEEQSQSNDSSHQAPSAGMTTLGQTRFIIPTLP